MLEAYTCRAREEESISGPDLLAATAAMQARPPTRLSFLSRYVLLIDISREL